MAGSVGGMAWFRLMPCWSGYRGTPNVRVRNHRNLTSSIPPPAGGEATCLRRRKPLLFGDIAVMLDAGGTQPRHADAVEHALPCRQFIGTHAISLTRLAGRQQSAIDAGDLLRLSPARPHRRLGRRPMFLVPRIGSA